MPRSSRPKFITATLVAKALLLFASSQASAGDIRVIANPSIKADTISSVEIKKIFLSEKTSLDDGTHVAPVLKRNGQSHETFLKEFLDMSQDALQDYYGSLVFSGKGSMPKQLGSDAEIVAYVARTRGAIGYVSAQSSLEGVKTLDVSNAGSSSERRLIRQIDPEYPETLKRLKIGGIVRLKVTLAPKGNVENVELLGGNPILAEAAIAAVKQWVYSPGHSRTTVELSVPFETH